MTVSEPIVINEVDTAAIRPLLARLNCIFCTERDAFQGAVDTWVSALNTVIEWIREHTRLAGLANRWEMAARTKQFLLRGQDIQDPDTWRDSHPREAPAFTPVHADFISASRRAHAQRQRAAVVSS